MGSGGRKGRAAGDEVVAESSASKAAARGDVTAERCSCAMDDRASGLIEGVDWIMRGDYKNDNSRLDGFQP